MDMKNVRSFVRSKLPFPVFIAARRVYRSVVSLPYRGEQYVCPLCRGHFSKMLPMGQPAPILKELEIAGGFRRNAKCPRCSSTERERLIYIYLTQNKQELFTEPIDMLHVAPEVNLRSVFYSLKNVNYLTADLYEPDVDEKMDISDIQKPDNSFDVIICSHVLEHVPQDHKAMSEFYRVLKPGGFGVLQVPISWVLDETIEEPEINDPEEQFRRFGQHDHVRIYGPDYVTRLEEAGFEVDVIDIRDHMTPEAIEKYVLMPEERLFICSKR